MSEKELLDFFKDIGDGKPFYLYREGDSYPFIAHSPNVRKMMNGRLSVNAVISGHPTDIWLDEIRSCAPFPIP